METRKNNYIDLSMKIGSKNINIGCTIPADVSPEEAVAIYDAKMAKIVKVGRKALKEQWGK